MLTLNKLYPPLYSLAMYGCDTYGEGAFGRECTTSTDTGGAGAQSGKGGLSFTGQEVILPIVIGTILIGAGIVSLLKIRKKK